MDVGLHLFDVARFLMGDVMRITCETQRLNPRVRGEDAFVALLTHESGAVSSVECSFDSQFGQERFPQTLVLVEGDAGTFELLPDYRVRWHRGGSRDGGERRAGGAGLGRAALAPDPGVGRGLRGACGGRAGRAGRAAAFGGAQS